jgi:hypothetical protein
MGGWIQTTFGDCQAGVNITNLQSLSEVNALIKEIRQITIKLSLVQMICQ